MVGGGKEVRGTGLVYIRYVVSTAVAQSDDSGPK